MNWDFTQYRNIIIIILLFIGCVLWYLSSIKFSGSTLKEKKGHTVTEYKGYKIQRRDKTGFTRVYSKRGKLVRSGHVSHSSQLHEYMDYYIKNKNRLSDCPEKTE